MKTNLELAISLSRVEGFLDAMKTDMARKENRGAVNSFGMSQADVVNMLELLADDVREAGERLRETEDAM